MAVNKKYSRYQWIERALALIASIIGVLSFLGFNKQVVSDLIPEVLQHSTQIPTISIFFFAIATLLLLRLHYADKKRKFSDRYYQNTVAISGLASKLNLSLVNESVCGLYIGIRRVGEQNEIKYFLQFLTITKVDENDFRFLLFDNYDGKEWFVEGACIKVQNSLVLKGAIDCQRDAVHTLFLKCPTHAKSDKLKGIISLTRLDVTSAMSTKVIFHKMNSQPSIGIFPKDAFKASDLGKPDLDIAGVYSEGELCKVISNVRFADLEDIILDMKTYIDIEPTDKFVVHS